MTPAEKAESLVLSFLHVPDEAMKRGSEAAWKNPNKKYPPYISTKHIN
jgi:hypothetical protein